jgi:polyhydroxyalkanoate synthesis regulator phasin
MSRKAKGKRPVYFSDPENDKLLAIIMAVAGELSVLRERLDTLERIVEAKGLLSLDEIERYRPGDQVSAERDQWRAEYLERILRIVHHELESAKRGETAELYEKVLKLVSSS